MYAGRGMLKTLLVERGLPGGELPNPEVIEDDIGFEHILGRDLAEKMPKHAQKFGAEIVTDTVSVVEREPDGTFAVRTELEKTYRAPAVIVTAGGGPPHPGATARSSRARCWPWGAAETRRWKKPTISRATRPRCTSCTAAISCGRPPSFKSGRGTTPRSSWSGTRWWRRSRVKPGALPSSGSATR